MTKFNNNNNKKKCESVFHCIFKNINENRAQFNLLNYKILFHLIDILIKFDVLTILMFNRLSLMLKLIHKKKNSIPII